MGIIKTETYTNEEGVEMVKDFYANGMVIDSPISNEEEVEIEQQPTMAEIYENQLIIMEALADLYAGGVENG